MVQLVPIRIPPSKDESLMKQHAHDQVQLFELTRMSFRMLLIIAMFKNFKHERELTSRVSSSAQPLDHVNSKKYPLLCAFHLSRRTSEFPHVRPKRFKFNKWDLHNVLEPENQNC
eukprot:TRINITY_DN6299_c0_g1_i12.p1 TRINITY_DN6299_c0_g1~~TRINITY_DN6299_c0_g1_i12.p1  ORF type:complete len:115 (+),score=10.56 TRINITY_DN6299_c0_g1_i12:954-1298(+)